MSAEFEEISIKLCTRHIDGMVQPWSLNSEWNFGRRNYTIFLTHLLNTRHSNVLKRLSWPGMTSSL